MWYIAAPFIMAVLVVIDQITKYFARADLADGDFVIWENVFCFSLRQNKGAAWSMLDGKVDFLTALSIVLLVIICYFYMKIPEGRKYDIIRFLALALGAGGLGNVIDRVRMGSVTDFLYIELIDFPVFNIADCYITFSVFIFILLAIFHYKDADLEFMGLDKTKKKPEEKQVTEGSDESKGDEAKNE